MKMPGDRLPKKDKKANYIAGIKEKYGYHHVCMSRQTSHLHKQNTYIWRV